MYLIYLGIIFHGSQAESAGSIDDAKVKFFCRWLNERATPDILFDTTRISPFVNDNTSTAMSLNFIHRFAWLQNHAEDCMSDAGVVAIFKRMRLAYLKSNFIFRERQAAFNTIRMSKISPESDSPDLDFYRNKMSCLLKFHGRKSIWSSKKINVRDDQALTEISNTLDVLFYGNYLIRKEKPSSCPCKDEEIGHTIVLIKEKSRFFVYDPSVGCLSLTRGKEHLFLHYLFFQYRKHLRLSTIRFFRVV